MKTVTAKMPISHRHRQRRQQEIPGRNAGGPRRHQFLAARQPREGEDAAQQNGEGQHLLAQIGQLQHRHADNHRRGDVMAGGAVEQIDDVDGEGQHQEGGIDHGDAEKELHRQIAVKRPGPTHAGASAMRRRARMALGL